MPAIAVEDDAVLRLVQVVLDDAAPAERREAFANYVSHELPDFDAWLAALRRDLPALYPSEVRLARDADALRRAVNGATIAVVESLPVDDSVLDAGPGLRFVQNFGIIPDNIDFSACERRSIGVRIFRRRTNIAVAEHTMGLLLALAKRLDLVQGLVTPERIARAGGAYRPFDTRHTARANWARIDGLRGLHGATLGLIGLGEIGIEVARMARAFEMTVLYHKRHPLGPEEEAQLCVRHASLASLLSASDFVSVHLPLNADTRGLLDRDRLAVVKPGALLVNTARAEIIAEDALVEALSSGRLGGVAMDVLYREPTSEDDPLLALPNVLLTPHLAGGSRCNGLDDMRDLLSGLNAAVTE